MVVTLGDCESRTQMREGVFVREHSLRGIGSSNRVFDRLARIGSGPEVVRQNRQMGLEIVLVKFFDRRTYLGVQPERCLVGRP
jgi:hypothetical protein